MAARRSSKSAASTGKRPQKTTGCTSLKPVRAWAVGFFSSVMVSPTAASATSLMEPVKKPISPAVSSLASVALGRKTPRRSTLWVAPAFIMRTCWPTFREPSMMRTRTTTPR